MTRILTALLLGLFLGIVAGILLWPFLVYRRSGAEPETEYEPGKCRNRTWLPYEDDDGFGYREWRCEQVAGHGGQHSGWLRDTYDGEAVGV